MLLISTSVGIQQINSLHSAQAGSDEVIKIYSSVNNRSALLDVSCMSVYLFDGNRRIIATECMNGKTVIGAMDLCKLWVYAETYKEADFAA